MHLRGRCPPSCYTSSFIFTLRLASTSAASTAAWAFSSRRCRTAYSGLVSQWCASAFRAASSPASPERSRAVSLATSFGSCGPITGRTSYATRSGATSRTHKVRESDHDRRQHQRNYNEGDEPQGRRALRTAAHPCTISPTPFATRASVGPPERLPLPVSLASACLVWAHSLLTRQPN